MGINLSDDINTTIAKSDDVILSDSSNPLQNELNEASEKLKLVDDWGDEFNPDIHDVNSDGTPKKTKTGKFRKKTKKNKKGNAVVNNEDISQENLVLAATCYDLYKRSHLLFGCEDLKMADDPKVANQMDMGTVQTIAKYFDYKDIEIKPGAAVLLALANVTLVLVKRNSETIKKKATWKVIGSKVKKLFTRKKKKQVEQKETENDSD